jgi:hypothetical protein
MKERNEDFLVGGRIDRILAWGDKFGPASIPLARPDDTAGVARLLLLERSFYQQHLHQRHQLWYYSGLFSEPMNGLDGYPPPVIEIVAYTREFSEGLRGDDLVELIRRSLLLEEDRAYIHTLDRVAPAEHNILTTHENVGDCIEALYEGDSQLGREYRQLADTIICNPRVADGLASEAAKRNLTVVETPVAYPDVAFIIGGVHGFIGVGGPTQIEQPRIFDWSKFVFGYESLTMTVTGFVSKITTV